MTFPLSNVPQQRRGELAVADGSRGMRKVDLHRRAIHSPLLRKVWTLAALTCGIALACVPIFSHWPGMSQITQYIAMGAVAMAGLTMLRGLPSVHLAVVAYVMLVAFWGFSFPPEESDSYYTLVKLALLALAIHIVVRTPKHLLLVLGCYSLAGSIALGLNWTEIREVRMAMELAETGADRIRLDGTFTNANRAGVFAAIVSVCSLIVFFNMNRWWRWVLLASGVGSGLIIGGLSGSRTGMLGLMLTALAVPLMASAGDRAGGVIKSLKMSLLVAVALGIVLLSLTQLPQFDRFLRLSEGVAADTSTEARWGMALAAIDVWKSNPISGAGFRGYGRVSEFHGRSAHSAFGQVLADGGSIGFALILLWYFLPAIHMVQLVRRHTSLEVRRLVVGLLAFWVVFVVMSVFSHLHASRDLIPMWAAICGCVHGLRRSGRGQVKPIRESGASSDSNHRRGALRARSVL
jgi:O-antigen ligase